jgi:hypothetical protein
MQTSVRSDRIKSHSARSIQINDKQNKTSLLFEIAEGLGIQSKGAVDRYMSVLEVQD